ncbi:MAG: LD-carboxypeptidase [Acidobacteriota bacterium]
MTCRKPPAVRSGDRVAVVAASSPFDRQAFEAGIAEIRRLGFEPVYDRRVFDHTRYLAGSASSRASALLDAWLDPRVAAVVTARGGFGSAQILPFVAGRLPGLPPKWLVGYSDVTSLLAHASTRAGLVCAHGPSVAGGLSGGEPCYDRSSLLRVLTGESPLGAMTAPGLEVLAAGEADGWLHGGNLTQLAASLGTPYAFDPPDGTILLLEDVNERPYRIERLLTQLAQAGILARARGLLFGEMPGCQEADGSLAARDIIPAAIADFEGPVLFGFPTGHTRGPAVTLPLGVRARLLSHPVPTLVIDERTAA